jgi:beta-N-acetylhexosaminidase
VCSRRPRSLRRCATLPGALVMSAFLLTACSVLDAPSSSSHETLKPSTANTKKSTTTTLTPRRTPSKSHAPSVTATSTRSAAPSPVDAAYNNLTLKQRVAQLFMSGVAADGPTAESFAVVADGLAGSVILTGRSYGGVAATAALTAGLQSSSRAAGNETDLLVATDQEGGEVQVLRGPGFATMPTALVQGTLDPSSLYEDATNWGSELRAAGVRLDLGPVMDTVPSPSFAGQNPPIGGFDREFGFTTAAVSAHGSAVVRGLAAAGVGATIKHFPGLGRVTENTDDSYGVTDSVTTADDSYLEPFHTAIQAGAPFVMMSTAVYSRIDNDHDAAFSPILIQQVLRQQLGFTGVVISDDLGGATQVQSVAVGQRATDFISAGGDLVLTVIPDQIQTMTDAVTERMAHDAAFAKQVTAAVKKVLGAKLSMGLVHT